MRNNADDRLKSAGLVVEYHDDTAGQVLLQCLV
jgi:hypothetical protein